MSPKRSSVALSYILIISSDDSAARMMAFSITFCPSSRDPVLIAVSTPSKEAAPISLMPRIPAHAKLAYFMTCKNPARAKLNSCDRASIMLPVPVAAARPDSSQKSLDAFAMPSKTSFAVLLIARQLSPTSWKNARIGSRLSFIHAVISSREVAASLTISRIRSPSPLSPRAR